MSKKSRAQKKRSRDPEALDGQSMSAPLVSVTAISNSAKRRAQKKRAQKSKHVDAEQERRERTIKKVERAAVGASMGLPVVHEDEDVLAISKPAGLLCHPSPGFWDHGTVVHCLPGRQRVAGAASSSGCRLPQTIGRPFQ